MKALFIPLTGQWYDAFDAGAKEEEFSPYGPRWNERTCAVGRAVTLSRGYGKHHRLSGEVVGFRVVGPEEHDAIRSIYPMGDRFAAIRIRVAR